MKEPIEYLGNVNSLTTREELYRIGKQMQIDAYNEAIKEAVENVEIVVTEEYDGVCRRRYSHKIKSSLRCSEDDYYYAIDKNSILKLLK